ncbi:MAG: DNA-processing protein DprA [Rhodoferax sp.]|uniref:DNA-processing protein DprA n=1 Tax=Rhodoferax sp. TaxID=50421 RepID=UPI001B6DC007|nr:DNA-processing protein DprA [Rhodoferax sp.]MBP9903972.1 DNA-processing protein DprA [Rhodoferax sp.]
MDADELRAWLRLTLTPGVGNASARKLLLAFGLPQQVFEQSPLALSQTVNSAQVQALGLVPDGLDALLARTLTWLAEDEPGGIRRQVATLGDALYPAALLHLDDPPLVLYLLGRSSFMTNWVPAQSGDGFPAIDSISNLAPPNGIDSQRGLAMVGSRNPTPQGLDNARQFARDLAQAGVTVVSGLALGIDGAAHEGALTASPAPMAGATVAVVGTGLDRVYPKAHRTLAHRIAEQGVLVSEYPLGTPPLNANFPKRNRLIAGLAKGTLVVEAALQSGSLITARLCNEQGKDVFAIPGSIHAAQSHGCHALIKQGAKLVESVDDILDELQWRTATLAPTASTPPGPLASSTDGGPLQPDDGLLQALGFDPVGLDALQARTGLDAPGLQAQLMVLELAGHVASLPGGLFQRQRS